jgi:hypothetical protein
MESDMKKPTHQEDILIFKLELKGGGFSSELHVPLPRTKAEVDKVVLRWLDFMATGLRLNAERMDATLGDQDV